MKSKFYSILLYFSLATLGLHSQDINNYVEVKGTVKEDRVTLPGSKVEVYVGNVHEKTYNVDSDGKFTCRLDLNKTYMLVVRQQGYFTKKLQINTNIPKEDVGVWTYRFTMNMILAIEGLDVSLLDDPIGKIEFVEAIGDFDYDADYTNSMQKKLKELMKEYERLKKEEYNRVIAKADEAFNQTDYEVAMELYDRAIKLDPYDTYPDDQMYAIGRIMQQDVNAQKNYDKNIAKADQYFNVKDYVNASLYYKRALNYKKEAPYPTSQIALIDKYLNDLNAANSDVAAREKAYKEALAAGEKAFVAKQYPSALENFTKASGIKPEEQYPKDKIAELNILMGNLANDAAAKEALQKQYLALIAQADGAFAQRNYIDARSNYDKASKLKPAETYPPQRIKEIDNLLASNKSIEEKYKGFILVAEKSFASKDYNSAKSNYEQALSVKPSEKMPKEKIDEITALMLAMANQKQKEQDEAYQRAIAEGDAAFGQKNYSVAKTAYSNALVIKDKEVYPKNRIAEIDKLLVDQANKKRLYDLAISRADIQFNSQNWQAALVDYQEALSMLPDEQYPQSRINEINAKLLALKSADEQKAAREKTYAEAITKADALIAAQKYQEAKNTYNQALTIKPNEPYPTNKIAEIDRIMLAQKDADARYNQIIATADALFVEKKYQDAKTTYQNALAIKPNEAYPKQKISEIDVLLAAILVQMKKDEDTQKQYLQLIATADAAFTSQSYAQAKATYTQASQLKANEVYPKQRIVEIDNLLASIADKDRKYTEAITLADGLMKQSKLAEALTAYNQAIGIKPNEQYPKDKVAEINGIFAKNQKDNSAYDNFILLADAAFSTKEFEKAKANYQSASGIKPAEKYPPQRIAEIDKLVAEQKLLQAQQEQLNAKYSAIIATADQMFAQKQYEAAKSKYTEASSVKPAEMYPKDKLAEIDILLKGIANLELSYKQKMTEGETLFNQKNYQGALTAYQQASQLKPDEAMPKQKMTEINALLLDLKNKKTAYDQFIATADNAFSKKELEPAKAAYVKAQQILPDELYPAKRIAEIDQLLAEQAKLNSERQRIDAAYNAAITAADGLLAQKNYDSAKAKYTEAQGIKPAEVYPKDKINEINNILSTLADMQKAYDSKIAEGLQLFNAKNYNAALTSYQQASQLKPSEQLPKDKITEIQNILGQQKQLQQQYQDLITKGDGLFNQKKYADARPVYQQAQLLMASETYPKDQIAKIDAFLGEAAKLQADLAAKVKAYQAKIAEADKQLAAKQYDNAISTYMDAKGIKADEVYPDQQIAKINQLVLDEAKQLDLAFNQAIANGDNFVKTKQYDLAKAEFIKAQNLKPNDNLPKSRLTDLQNRMEAEQNAMASQAKLDKDYAAMVLQADNAFKAGDFNSAISYYHNAQRIKPAEKYPPERIALCEQRIRDKQAADAAEAEKKRQAELAASQSSFSGKDFDYSGEQRDRQFLNDLAKQYPEGITVENYEKPNKKIKRVIVNYDGIAKEYIQVSYSYGTFYFRNGQNISQSVFSSETRK